MLVGQIHLIAIGMSIALAAGCSTIDGGAVELSWKLRPSSGAIDSLDPFTNCTADQAGAKPVTKIRLDWIVGDSFGRESWTCDDFHGVTGFELPPGEALLSVVPECESGAAATDTYTAPAPDQRSVVVGNVISLGAIEIVVQVGIEIN